MQKVARMSGCLTMRGNMLGFLTRFWIESCIAPRTLLLLTFLMEKTIFSFYSIMNLLDTTVVLTV